MSIIFGNAFTTGIDNTKPIGLYVVPEAGDFHGVAFIPVSDLKVLLAQAHLHWTLGDLMGARGPLARALDLYETLGTLDEPRRVQDILAKLEEHC